MTARTVIQSSGLARRVVLKQPPHFRTGRMDAPAADRAADDAVRALQTCDSDRSSYYRSTGVRAVTTK